MEDFLKKVDEKADRLKKLVREYQKSKEVENKKYHLLLDMQLDFRRYQRFYLIDLSTHKIKCYGPADRLKSYMRLRKISKDQVLQDENLKNVKIEF